MGEKPQSDSETDESSENSSSDEVKNVKNGVSEYEKKRIERIKENKARLEALRLPSLATYLMGSVKKKNRKGKEKKGEEEDEEYKPSDGEEKASSSSEELLEEDDDDEDDEWSNESSYSSRVLGRKGKSKTSLNKSTRKKKNPVQKRVEEVEYVDDDEALKKAIALSLGGSLEISCPLPHGPPQNCRVNFELEERKEGNLVQENDKRKKRRKSSTSRVQMTKDQVIVHFFQFDDMQRVTPMGIGKQKFQCKYCGDIMGGGGMTSLKEHLAGSSSIITACEQVPLHIREEMGKQIPERASSPARVTLEQQALQPQVVWPQEEEEEDFELKLQQDIEEAMRRSMKDPDYQEMEEIKIAMMESQRLSSQYLERASSSQTPQMTVMAQDSDEELDRMLGLCDDDNDM